MTNILVTGGNGQLGSEIKDVALKYSNYNFYFTDSSDLDITNHEKVEVFVAENS